MAWLRFFCSTSSLLVLMQMPMVGAVRAAHGRERTGRGSGGDDKTAVSSQRVASTLR